MNTSEAERTLHEEPFGGGSLVLTSRRVRVEQGGSSAGTFASIPLDQVAYCGISTRRYPILLVFAVAAGGVGLLGLLGASKQGGAVACASPALIIACILALAYFAFVSSRFVVAASSGHQIAVPVSKGGAEAMIDAVLNARLAASSR